MQGPNNGQEIQMVIVHPIENTFLVLIRYYEQERRFWSSSMTPALQECLGRELLTDPRGDSAEKQLDGSKLDVREFNHGPIW